MVHIIAFSGSLRKESYNKKLVKIAASAAEDAGASVTFIDFKDYPLPFYDGDLEEKEGLPENAKKLKKMFKAADGFLISSPEYNSGMSGVLKNVIDWVSRKESPDEQSLECFRGKYASVMSASPGGLGGLRGLFPLRYVLTNIHVQVLTDQFALSRAYDAFTESGSLKIAEQQTRVESLGRNLVKVLQKLKA